MSKPHTEMDLLRMTERQRRWWLQANRVTLMLVGLVWLAMIAERLARGEPARFLIVMVPVFALARFAAYHCFRIADRDSLR